MSRPYFASEIVETLHVGDREQEVVATIEGRHDAGEGRLHARVDAVLREVNPRGADAESRPDWLPRSQEMTEGVESSEANALARDLFHQWVGKVREAVRRHREGD